MAPNSCKLPRIRWTPRAGLIHAGKDMWLSGWGEAPQQAFETLLLGARSSEPMSFKF